MRLFLDEDVLRIQNEVRRYKNEQRIYDSNVNDKISNVNDKIPFMNILTFGTCKMIPPTPAGPVPCVPAIIMAWKSCDMHYFVGGAPALTKDSFLTCTFGGTIKFQ